MHHQMCIGTDTTLLTVMQAVPPLLLACVGGDMIFEWKSLRLVSKEASRLALLSCVKYTLNLRGYAEDSDISKASLLASTCLRTLNVSLHLTGAYSPADLLEAFMHHAEASLNTVSKLGLELRKERCSTDAVTVLSKSMGLLVGACPVLRSLEFEGHMPLTLLHRVGEVCPLLQSLMLMSSDHDVIYIQSILKQLPTLLPLVDSLRLVLIPDLLPDMSQNPGILYLDWDGQHVNANTCWSFFPPNMQKLRCGECMSGPIAKPDAKTPLGGLLCIDITVDSMSLPVLVQLLQAAPALRNIKMEYGFTDAVVEIDLNSVTCSDLTILSRRLHVLRDPVFEIKCDIANIEGSEEVFFAALPCLPGVKYCKFSKVAFPQLPLLLKMCPDVEVLSLKPVGEFVCEGLQDLAMCAHVTALRLLGNVGISPMQLLALCHGVPSLRSISHWDCDSLTGSALVECMQGLARGHVNMKVLEINDSPPFCYECSDLPSWVMIIRKSSSWVVVLSH